VESERQRERGDDREERDDQPGAELVEVLDERGLFTMVEAAWEPPAERVQSPLGDRLPLALRSRRLLR